MEAWLFDVIRRRWPGRPCAVTSSLELVGDRWSLLIVREVTFGNHRFSQIARNTGAPRDRLAARLRSLVDAGILDRRLAGEGARYEGLRTARG
ncbi:transcriptional regulator, HxlR family [Actinobacteria bacterium OK006]|nr:transcriptional regulator, HxlR family [Actinobacteria bacterium OK006]